MKEICLIPLIPALGNQKAIVANSFLDKLFYLPPQKSTKHLYTIAILN